jgi:hypothetical protein
MQGKSETAAGKRDEALNKRGKAGEATPGDQGKVCVSSERIVTFVKHGLTKVSANVDHIINTGITT